VRPIVMFPYPLTIGYRVEFLTEFFDKY
jgi:hypothetical protein